MLCWRASCQHAHPPRCPPLCFFPDLPRFALLQAAVPLQPVGIAANPALAAQVASNPALAAQFAANPALAAQFGLGGAYAAAGGAAGMRVAVDKGRNAALDHTFVAGARPAGGRADALPRLGAAGAAGGAATQGCGLWAGHAVPDASPLPPPGVPHAPRMQRTRQPRITRMR